MIRYINRVCDCGSMKFESIIEDLKELSKYSDVAKKMVKDTDENHVLFFFEPEIWEGNSFHPQKSGCLELDDWYMFGIRCNHLVWVEGYSEEDCDLGTIYLMGNHKGELKLYCISLIDTIDEEGEVVIFFDESRKE